MSETYTGLFGRVKKTSADAVLFYLSDEEHDQWIPRSVIENNGENFRPGWSGRFYVKEWWAEAEELV